MDDIGFTFSDGGVSFDPLSITASPSGDVGPAEFGLLMRLAELVAKAVQDGDYREASGWTLAAIVVVLNKFLLPRLRIKVKDGETVTEQQERLKSYIPTVVFMTSFSVGMIAWCLKPSLEFWPTLKASVGVAVVAAGTWWQIIKPIMRLAKALWSRVVALIERARAWLSKRVSGGGGTPGGDREGSARQ